MKGVKDLERLLREVKTYGFDTEDQAKAFVEEMAEDCAGTITKHSIEQKTKKAKGEIIAEQYQLTTQVDYEKIFDYLIDEVGGAD